ncbi:MAG TPA: glycine zipper 2TM domain-containing protein [Caldimonas sp.]|nr:glycine zipper 2TM domain-containing protein [Caldimonas sp.]
MMKAVVIALAVGALSACATQSPDVVRPYEAQRMSQVYDATVLSVRPVTIQGQQSGIGAGAGAVTGAVAGSTIGGHRDSIVGGVLGAVVGGVIGNAVERGATQQNAVEILVQLRNGERRAIVQANGNEGWSVGEPVVLVTTDGRTRVTRAPQVYPAAPQGYPPLPPPPVYPPSGPVPPRS